MESGYTREEIEKMQHSRVRELRADFIGNVIVKKYKDDLVFCSQFLQEDVEYFRDVFRRRKEITDPDYLWYDLRGAIEEKLRIDGDRSHIEPYLYALKLEDNCFGSELSGQNPDPGRMRAYVKAVNCIYEMSDKEQFFKVVKHALVNWEWYQPLHAVISLCGEYPQFQDPEVDDILRTHLLYRKMYSRTTFDALLKRPSIANYEELLQFLMRGVNKDVVTGAEIPVDSALLNKFDDTISVDKNSQLFLFVQNTYITKFRERAMKSWIRERLERIFGEGEKEEAKWNSMFCSFRGADEEEKTSILQKVRMDFRVSSQEDMGALAVIQDQEILDVVAEKLELAGEKDRAWGIFTLGKNKHPKVAEYVRKKCEETQEHKEHFSYMLSAYISSGKPDIEHLCSYYFTGEYLANENIYGSMLKAAVSNKKASQEFRSCVERLVVRNKEKDEDSLRLLSRLKWVFGYGNSNAFPYLYPVEAMNGFLEAMLEKGLQEKNYAVLDSIVAILDKTMMNTTKSRYEDILLKITGATDKNSSQFKQAREILRRVYGR